MRFLLLPLFLCALDIICTGIAFISAVYLRFDMTLPEPYLATTIGQLPAFIGIVVLCAIAFRLYMRMWKYAGSSELLAVGATVLVSMLGCYGFSTFVTKTMVPRSMYIIAGMVLLILMGGTRLSLRVYSYLTSKPRFMAMFKKYEPLNLKKVLVVGAGDAGAVIVKEIERYHSGNRTVIGLIDDDNKKQGTQMLGVKVLGDRFAIKESVVKYGVEEIIVAMPSVKGEQLRQILEICKRTQCRLQILPGIYELVDGVVSVSQLRNVEIADLLGRKSVVMDTTAVKSYIAGKIVLVTGAGGSIGSEICRQVAKMGPAELLLLGKGENSIYEITQELNADYPQIKKHPIIADVRDRKRIAEIMETYKPQLVFHAAAHKHVPLMEYQPIEAVKNNVLGTRVVAEEAAAHKAEAFVMISTDKAVNPTSVMGCTKRVAEMFVQSMNGTCDTRYVAVRFGNVLGSRGSVIPLFKKQIAKGGPVTVTHPDMKRYFMTIPEASQLVLQAGTMAKGGEVFVLDMGEPVKISDLAKDLITLSGLTPDKDIEIKYTGLRPGEKLFEELLSAEDGTDTTKHEKIFTARIKHIDKAKLEQDIDEILQLEEAEDVVAKLQQIVPVYTPNRECFKK